MNDNVRLYFHHLVIVVIVIIFDLGLVTRIAVIRVNSEITTKFSRKISRLKIGWEIIILMEFCDVGFSLMFGGIPLKLCGY